jgi:hypothetical protein
VLVVLLSARHSGKVSFDKYLRATRRRRLLRMARLFTGADKGQAGYT